MSSSFDIQTRGSRAQQNSTEASDGDVVVIVSHQRSGTHLTADFLRRNFPELALVPKPWESAEVMFYNLDRLANNRPDGWSEKALKNRSFMVLTHLLPFDPDLQDHLERLRGVRRCIMIYPFRRFSKTMASLHSYKGRTEPLSEFVTNPSPTFDPDLSVCEAWLNHANWGLERCYHINVEALLKAPEQHAQRLHDSFGWTFGECARPLAAEEEVHRIHVGIASKADRTKKY